MLKILEDINSLYEMSKTNKEARPTLLKAARVLLKHTEYLLLDENELSEHEFKALMDRRKIEAIKLYMTRTGKGIAESKVFIENQMINIYVGKRINNEVRFKSY